MRKYLTAVLAAALLASLTGCASKDASSPESAAASRPDTEAVEIEADTAPVPAEESDPEIEASGEAEAEEIVIGTADKT